MLAYVHIIYRYQTYANLQDVTHIYLHTYIINTHRHSTCVYTHAHYINTHTCIHTYTRMHTCMHYIYIEGILELPMLWSIYLHSTLWWRLALMLKTDKSATKSLKFSPSNILSILWIYKNIKNGIKSEWIFTPKNIRGKRKAFPTKHGRF